MKKIDPVQATQILSNLGVIVGIIFLAVEVSQNQASFDKANDLSQMMVTQSSLEKFNVFRYAVAQDEGLAELILKARESDSLSPVEAYRFDQLCKTVFWNSAVMAHQYDIVGQSAPAEALGDSMRQIIEANTGWRSCWERVKPDLINYGFPYLVNAVEEPAK